MRASEFINENASAGATGAGSIAATMSGLGHMPALSRTGGNLLTGKYTNVDTPNTPKKRKNRAK
jgi:hypothetical protein